MRSGSRIWNNFITGLAVLLPTLITILILVFIIDKINELLLDRMVAFFKPHLVNVYLAAGFKILIFIIIVALISLIGVAARIIVVRKLFSFGEKIVFKMPMIGKMYNATKQISRAFLGQGKSIFKQVVLVEYPRKGTWSIGFFMSEEMSAEIKQKTQEDVISIFVPTTPNPTSGMYLLVPRRDVIFLDMSVEDGLKLIISGGTVTP